MGHAGEAIEPWVTTFAGIELLGAENGLLIDPEAMLAGSAFHGPITKVVSDLESLPTGGAADLQLFRVFVVRKHDFLSTSVEAGDLATPSINWNESAGPAVSRRALATRRLVTARFGFASQKLPSEPPFHVR
ncbi:MAG: hypothetical protein CFE26_03925 [Verrucomicrobiales bacterium VVV1]|nr:MAG: hypothetical protein CFE26_03925 [Verrucomicrobiales bacterium VVV1]